VPLVFAGGAGGAGMARRKGAMPHATGFARGGRAECCGIRRTIPAPPAHCGCARVTDLGVNVQSLLVREAVTRGDPVPRCVSGGRWCGRDGASKRRDAACHGLRPGGQGGMLRYSSHHPGPTSSLRMRPGHGPWCDRSIVTGERAQPGSVGDYRSAPPIAGGSRDWLHRELSTAEPGWARRPPQPEWTYESSTRVGPGVHSPPCGRRTKWSPTAPPEGAGFPWWQAPS
jgi:hypothetical protein